MEDYENSIRQNLACTLGDLSEVIIRRLPPFDTLSLQNEVMPYFYMKYLQYFDEVEVSLREQILARLIDYARWEIKSMFVRGIESFNLLYPEHVETSKTFKRWITQKEGLKSSSQGGTQPSIKNLKIIMIIKRVMCERMPAFKYDKSIYIPGTVPFSNKFLGDNNILIMADTGTKRRFINFMLGIHYPRAFIDIANFFGKSQSIYEYSSEEEASAGVNKALDMIEILLPHFVERVQKTLTASSSRGTAIPSNSLPV
jgi:hypothetical protein